MSKDQQFTDPFVDSAGERITLSSPAYAGASFSTPKASGRLSHQPPDQPAAADLTDASLEDTWSVPWSDLMMVMFVLFATLLIIDMREPETELVIKPEPIVEQIDKDVFVDRPSDLSSEIPNADLTSPLSINVFDESQQAIKTAALADVEIALLSDQSVKVSVQGPMLFELGKADLRNEVKSFLDSLAFVIRQTPFEVRVVGHTDDKPINTGIFPSNWELSLVRASRVARYLIRSGELDPTRFVVMGRGQYAPVASNDDDDSRALNRRVEIIITRKQNVDTALAADAEQGSQGDSS